jgi:steroid delta-isomerase-like uncharacterized protein
MAYGIAMIHFLRQNKTSKERSNVMKRLFIILPFALILCFMVGCQDKAAMAELEKFKAQAAVEEQNKELARTFFSELDKNNFDELKKLVSDDFSFMGPGLSEPLRFETALQGAKATYAAFPDWSHTIEELVAEGDKVAVKIMQTGTHKGEFEAIPPTDKSVTMPAQVFLVISDGKIKEFWAMEDYLSFFLQLGLSLIHI